MKHAIITICLMVLASAACAYGAELLVPSQFSTIQLAVNAAAPGDTVILADGTYTGPGNTNIILNKAITVRSENGPENCIIDCNSGLTQSPGFIMSDGTLAGLTITRSRSAVTCESGQTKLINCILTNNRGSTSGAIYCRNGNLEVINCSLTSNKTTINAGTDPGKGGAIFCENSAAFIANSNISDNLSTSGGGIYCTHNSNMIIKNCLINDNNVVNNWSSTSGGGIYCERSSLTVIGSQIFRNTAATGAGICSIDAASVFVSDCNINHNISEDLRGRLTSGGGIYLKSITPLMYGTSFLILNTSITDNVTKGSKCTGGGLYVETPISSSPLQNVKFMITGCIIARNSAQGYPGSVGGLYCKGAVQMTETEVLNNSAIGIGGICNTGPSISMSRCRISGNFAKLPGSAICSGAGEIILENCIISGNQDPEGGTIECVQNAILKMSNCTVIGNDSPAISMTYPTNSLSSITNSIIFDNRNRYCPLCIKPIDSQNILVSYSDIQGGFTGVDNINADPCFVKAGYWDTNGTPNPFDDFWVEGDYRLTAVSPCIDTGGVAFLMDNKDLAGNPRITGAALDMGAYEYQNSTPIAEAGPEQVVYAWIDGIVAVTLDGIASHDADGDELSYLWSWSIDGNNYEANGVSPAIEMPVGQHRIELIVNDGLVDSWPDDVNVTVIGPVEGRMWTVPRVINRQGWQPYILAMLKLPEGITKEQIDPNYKLLLYPGGIEAVKQHIIQGSNGGHQQIAITAFFDKASLLAGINGVGPVQLVIVGQLTTGQYFFGQDKIWIINPRPQPKLNLLDQ